MDIKKPKGRPRIVVTGGDVVSIESEISKDVKFSQGIRLFAVLQVARGIKPQDLEGFYHTSFKSVLNWVHRYNKGGVEALKDKPKPGRPSRLSDEQKMGLKKTVLEQVPQDFGYNSGTWSGPILRDLIGKLYNVEYGKVQVYNLLKELGLTHQKGKAYYPEAATDDNKEKREELKKTPKY